jgi:hypothetical protein
MVGSVTANLVERFIKHYRRTATRYEKNRHEKNR